MRQCFFNKTLGFNITARVVVVVFQFINIGLYTHALQATQLGIYFFLLTVSYAANALVFVPLDYYQQAHLSQVMKQDGGLRTFLHFNIKVLGYYSVFSLCCVCFCVVWFPAYTISALLVVLLSMLLYIVQALRNTLNNLEYRTPVSISFVQEAVMKVLFFFMMTYFFAVDAHFLVLAWLASLVITAMYLAFKARVYCLFRVDKFHPLIAYDIFIFAYPFSIGAICNWFQLQGYRLILVPLGFEEEVGIFATLSSIGSAAIGAVSLIYSQQFTPQLYQSKGGFTAQYLKGACVVSAAVALVSFGIGDLVVALFTSAVFEPHWKLLLYGVVTDAGNLFIGALAIHMTLKNHTHKIMMASFVGVLAMLVVFAVLYYTAQMSVVTIGLPLLVSQWMVVIYMYRIFKKSA